MVFSRNEAEPVGTRMTRTRRISFPSFYGTDRAIRELRVQKGVCQAFLRKPCNLKIITLPFSRNHDKLQPALGTLQRAFPLLADLRFEQEQPQGKEEILMRKYELV